MKFSRQALFICLSASILLAACSQKPPPDDDMTKAPNGIWTGVSNPDISLDIQPDGSIKFTQGGTESFGSWKMKDEKTLTITLNSETSDCSFERKDLELKITLPGQTTQSTFSQM